MTLHQNVQSTITKKQKINNGDKKQVVSKLLVIHIAQKQRASKHVNKQSNRTAEVNFIFQRNFKNVLFCCLFLTAAIFTHLLFRIYSVCMCVRALGGGSVFISGEAISCSWDNYFYVG